MAEKFSGIVQITDLNDFIAPGQECIKDPGLKPDLIKTNQKQEGQISLSDCLAWSGCITSAEVVLLESYSVKEVESRLGSVPVVFSISQQSLLSLSGVWQIPSDLIFSHVQKVLMTKGVSVVEMQTSEREQILQACADEFIQRFRAGNLPVISSECPGWTSYSEKKASAVENLSSQRSVMAAACYTQSTQFETQSYIVAVEPCNDKKIEAIRITEVDNVINTEELAQWIGPLEFDESLPSVPLDTTSMESSSFGYAEVVFLRAAEALFESPIQAPPEVKRTRRKDLSELTLVQNGKEVLKFAIAYGFTNIQNITRQIKMGRCPYHYIELMACPGGCLNGGGQLSVEQPRESLQTMLQELANKYRPPVDVERGNWPIVEYKALPQTESIIW